MTIIIAASSVEPDVESLVDQYDNANSDDQREIVATELFALVGSKIRSMISFSAKGHQLSADELNGLALQAFYRGLNESGLPRFQLKSATDRDWQPQIQKMMAAANSFEPSPAARVWSMLSSKTHSAVLASPKYIKAAVQNQLVADLNAILKRRDFYTPLLWHRTSLPHEAQQLMRQGLENLSSSKLARLNSILIVSAFSDVEIPTPPKRNLLGYISSTVIPQMKPQLWETATGRQTDRTLVEAWSALRDDFAAVQQMQGIPDDWRNLPIADQILRHYRQRIIARYGPVVGWWNQCVKELLPERPFVVHDAATLRAARELLEKNRDRIPEELWKSQTSQFYMPISVFQPYGRATIERLLTSEGFGLRGSPTQSPMPPMYTQQPATEDADAMRLLAGGHQSRVFRWFVDRFYSAPGFEAERAIGAFLTSVPTPTNQQIQNFIESLPNDLAELINEVGFRNLARQIDERVLKEVKKPEIQNELRSVVGPQRSVSATMRFIRKAIFCRTSELILSRCA